jgi:carboxypeptidase Taq
MAATKEYKEFLELIRELNTLEQVASLLGWDEQTYMPAGASPDRALQNSAVAGIIHEKLTSPRMGKLIRALKKQELPADGAVILREVEHKWRKASSVPGTLVKEISKTGSLGFEAWMKARKDSDFKKLEPVLGKMIDLKMQVAEHVGYEDKPTMRC